MKQKRFNLGFSALLFQIGLALFCSRSVMAEEPELMSEKELDSEPVSSPPTAPAPISFASGTSQIAPFGSLVAPGSPSALSSLLRWRWGPFELQIQPAINYSFTRSDGIQSQPGQTTDTTVHNLNSIGSVVLLLGDHWTFTYSPSLSFYSDDSDTSGEDDLENSFNHSFNLTGQTTYKAWSFSVSQDYVNSFSPLVETAAQTDQESFSTSFNASRAINSRASISLSLNQSLRFVESLDSTTSSGDVGDSRDWSTTDWLNYQLNPKISTGIGVVFGYSQNESDMTYEQLNGRIGWMVDSKLNLSLTAGVESRQFLGDNIINPLFSATIAYQLFPATSLSLSANHSVNTSFFENQITENTVVSAGLSQRLLGKYSLTLHAAAGRTDYVGEVGNVSTDRQDDTFSYGATLSRSFLARGSVSVFWSENENSSGETDFDYTSTQIGFQIGYQF